MECSICKNYETTYIVSNKGCNTTITENSSRRFVCANNHVIIHECNLEEGLPCQCEQLSVQFETCPECGTPDSLRLY